MLDFYFLKDDQPKPGKAERLDLELAGRLDEYAFEDLQTKNIVDRRFDYYCSSFRWDTSLIKQIQEKLMKINTSRNDSVNQLTELLENAAKKQSGLIAYGD